MVTMMRTTIYCDAYKCKATTSVGHEDYHDMGNEVNVHLTKQGWEIYQDDDYQQPVGHYCPACHKDRKEEAHGDRG